MKKVYLKILAALVVVIMISTVSVGDIPEAAETAKNTDTIYRAIPSAVEWSDNFDDEDISDWQIFKVNHTATPDTLMPGNTTAEGGVMRHHETEWSYAGHNSTVAFGTWIFDIDIQWPVDEYHFYVAFISEIYDDDWLIHESVGSVVLLGFYLDEYGDTTFRIVSISHEDEGDWMDVYTGNDIIGWNNIIITRDPSGQFYVYLNDKLILDGISLQHTTSERFYFLSPGGPAIDNITVHDDIIYDAAPPEWDQLPTDQMIDEGTEFSYDLNATDYSGIDQYWINDTVNFVIDDDGIITSVDVLQEGSYVLEVNVNDTLGFTQTEVFRLTVRALPPEMPMELIIGGVGTVVLVIVALVVWRKRG